MNAYSECCNTGAPNFIQSAGIAACRGGRVRAGDARALPGRRRSVMEILAPHPRIELHEPVGAFYAFPRIRGLRNSLGFAQGLLAEEDVGVAPGYTFAPANEDHFRVCFAKSNERLETAPPPQSSRYLDRHDNDFG